MQLAAVSVVALWLPVLVLACGLVLLGVRRDRGRSRGRGHVALVTAVLLSVLVLSATAAFVGWASYQQQRADESSCSVPGEC